MVRHKFRNYITLSLGILVLSWIVYACTRDGLLPERTRQTNRELTTSAWNCN